MGAQGSGASRCCLLVDPKNTQMLPALTWACSAAHDVHWVSLLGAKLALSPSARQVVLLISCSWYRLKPLLELMPMPRP